MDLRSHVQSEEGTAMLQHAEQLLRTQADVRDCHLICLCASVLPALLDTHPMNGSLATAPFMHICVQRRASLRMQTLRVLTERKLI